MEREYWADLIPCGDDVEGMNAWFEKRKQNDPFHQPVGDQSPGWLTRRSGPMSQSPGAKKAGHGLPLAPGLQQVGDLLGIRKAMGLAFGENKLTVRSHFKLTVGSGDEFGRDPDFTGEGVRQTGGAGAIVSGVAIGDGDVHLAVLHASRFGREFDDLTQPKRSGAPRQVRTRGAGCPLQHMGYCSKT